MAFTLDEKEIERVARERGVDPADLRTRALQQSGRVGVGGAIRSGLVNAAGQLGDVANLAMRGAQFLSTGSSGGDGADVGQMARRGAESMLGPAPLRSSMTSGERLIASGTTGAATALPFAVLPGGTTGAIVRRALLESVSGASGQITSDIAEGTGAGPGGQFIAGMAGGLAPLGMFRGVRSAGRLLDQARSQQARQLAARENVSGALARAVGPRVRERAQTALGAEAAGTAGFGRATTGQAIEDIAPNIRRLERAAARESSSGGELVSGLKEMLDANQRVIVEEANKAFPSGATEATMKAWQRAATRLHDRTAQAYLAVGNMGGFPTAGLKAQADVIAKDAGQELAEDAPGAVLKLIRSYGDTVDLQTLRRLRRKVTKTIAGAVRDPERQVELKYLEGIKQSIDETMDEVAKVAGAPNAGALRTALAKAADEAKLIGPRRGAGGRSLGSTRLFLNAMGDERENIESAFRRYIINSDNPSREVGRLRMLIGDDTKAWQGLQGMLREQVFGKDLEKLTNKSTLNALRGGNMRRAWEAVYGPGSADNAIDFVKRARKIDSGVEGRIQAATRAGSSVGSLGESTGGFMDKVQNLTVLADVVQGRLPAASLKLYRMVVGKMPETVEETHRLLTQALLDPKVANGFLEPLGPEAFDGWARRAARSMNITRPEGAGRVAARSGIAATGETR